MRAILVVLLALLAPSVVGSSAFEPREGTFSLSCPSTLYVGVLGAYTPGYSCHDRVAYPAGPSEGVYVAELSWTPAATPTEVFACLSTVREVASLDGLGTVWTNHGSACASGTDGVLGLRLPASAEDGEVHLSVQLRPAQGPDPRPLASVRFGLSQDVAFTLAHEP